MIFFPTGSEYVYNRMLIGIYGSFIAIGVTAVLLKWDKKSFREIGFIWEQGTLYRFLKGFIIGAVIVLLSISILVATTKYTIVFNQDVVLWKAILGLIAFLPLAFMEEIIYRGYPLIKLRAQIGIRWSLVVMAILFAYYHDITASTLHWQLLGPGIWGIVYGIYAFSSKGIAMPTGIHMAANVVLALLGTKHSVYAVWNLELIAQASESAETHAHMVSVLLQVALLIFGIFLVEYYIRKKQEDNFSS
ncbi:MAG: CPBP family intramembrane glutamic endopeptidase [Bacteroidota bacterium]